jgi:hypothetical protein
MARTSCRVRYGTGPEARGVWHDALTGAIGRCRSLPCPRIGGISSPEAIGQQRERRVYAKPFLAPEAFQLVRGRPFSRMPASVDGEDYGMPSITTTWFSSYYEVLLWQKARGLDAPSEANGRLPRYERICKGILLADGAGLAELIQKRTSLGSALDQSGLLSWPIFCFCRAVVVIIAQRCISFARTPGAVQDAVLYSSRRRSNVSRLLRPRTRSLISTSRGSSGRPGRQRRRCEGRRRRRSPPSDGGRAARPSAGERYDISSGSASRRSPLLHGCRPRPRSPLYQTPVQREGDDNAARF